MYNSNRFCQSNTITSTGSEGHHNSNEPFRRGPLRGELFYCPTEQMNLGLFTQRRIPVIGINNRTYSTKTSV